MSKFGQSFSFFALSIAVALSGQIHFFGTPSPSKNCILVEISGGRGDGFDFAAGSGGGCFDFAAGSGGGCFDFVAGSGGGNGGGCFRSEIGRGGGGVASTTGVVVVVVLTRWGSGTGPCVFGGGLVAVPVGNGIFFISFEGPEDCAGFVGFVSVKPGKGIAPGNDFPNIFGSMGPPSVF